MFSLLYVLLITEGDRQKGRLYL